MIRLITGLFVVSILLSPNSSAQTISGAIASDTTWSGTVIADSVNIPAGRILTIKPGSVVRFNNGKMLVIAGRIVANGTYDSTITFTSNAANPVPGSWNGVELQNTASVSSVINYCIFEYGGGGPNAANIFYKTGTPNINISHSVIQRSLNNGINPRSSSPRISTSMLRFNGGYGVFADLSLNYTIDSCTISNNTTGGLLIGVNATTVIINSSIDSNGIGIFISNSAVPTIIKNNIRRNNIGIQFAGVGGTQPTITQDTIVNNISWGFLNTSTSTTVLARRNYWGSDTGPFNSSSNPTGIGDKVSNLVDFQPWTILAPTKSYTILNSGTISKDSTWSNGVFWLKGTIVVSSGFKLTIKPGVIVKLASGVRLTVNGSINAIGTPDSLIIFTSDKDDSYGGDTNGDSTATLAARGNWDNVWLYYNQNNSSVISNCIIKWGGSGGWGNILCEGASPTINNIFSTQSSNYGLTFYSSSNSTLSNSTLSANGSNGVYLYNSNPNIYGSTIANNGSYGIYAIGNSRFTVRKSKLTGNTYGIYADGGTSSATLVSMDSSIVSFNSSAGLYLWYGTGTQTFSYNRIEGNGSGYGLWCFNVNSIVTIDSNIILNNGSEGIVTSKALITNNLIQGNSYPITLIGRVHSTYNGNTIVGNRYNNALAIRLNRSEESLLDTLSTVFPAGINSKTYVLIDNNSGVGVSSGTTLVIQPGVTIKMAAGMYFRVDGTLIANGTLVNPIVFTSYRDASYGGKTNLLTDTTSPAPNDWRYVRFYTSSSSGSILNNCIFKYGGQDGSGNLWLSNNIVFPSNSFTNIISRKSSSYGIYVYDCQATFDNVTLDSNANYGMYVDGSRPSDVTVRNSIIQDNNGTGMQAVYNSAFREISNCFIRRNNGWGIGTSNGTLDQVYQGNTVTNNASGGINTNSPSIPPANLRFVGNTVTDNPGAGILSSRATFIDNIIQRNIYPIAVWRRTGNIYTDPGGNDGNIITNNVYNNAIALWSGEISDTLKVSFPQAITSKTYVAISDLNVASGTTLVIEPGVNIKFQQVPVNTWHQFNVYGTLIANGNIGNPIIFTSWRDSSAGGKTTSLTDFLPPVPGDWYYIGFHSGSGASVIRNCQFKYGGRDGMQTVYFESNVGGITFSNNVVRRSLASGIYLYNTSLNIDSTVVDSCAESGIQVSGNTVNSLSLRNSKIMNNANYGVWLQSSAKFPILSNCIIANNTYSGVYVENNTVALSVIGNTIMNNGDHGLYILSRNDAIDTLLMIAGNKIRNNGLAGIFSSRAYIVDDSISGNRYPIGVVGQLSLAASGTASGNVYQNNTILGNTHNNVLVTQDNIFGILGGSFPPNFTKMIVVRADLYVSSGTALRISPGSIFKFAKESGNGYFQVNGTLLSEGTTNNKIIFTSWNDDTYVGDTNLDSISSVPAPGDWNQIYLNGASTNGSHFLNTIVRYGDIYGSGSLGFNTTNAAVESCVISYAKYYGIDFSNSSSQMVGTEIHHNGTGVQVYGSPVPTLNYNNIYQNSSYGLYSYYAGATVNAQYNYWGAANGPLKTTGSNLNPTGQGNQIYVSGSGDVDYSNFLHARQGVLFGDVSGNGQISAYDGSMILQYLVNPAAFPLNLIQRTAANVSGDTTVSALDASYILRYVVGLISGFPGLGKQSLEADIASAFSFNIVKGVNPNEFNLIIRLNKPANIFGMNVSLSFDTTMVRPLAIEKTVESDSMALFYAFPKGYANIAMAGTNPLNSEGNVARLSFTLLDPAKGEKEILFTLKKFVLNETDVTGDVGSIVLKVDKIIEIPTTFALSQNYPNPFNPATTIQYSVPTVSTVKISVYNMLGQEVKTLVNTEQRPGFYSLIWNGTDNNNAPVASGMYIYRIDARADGKEMFTRVKKMILVK